MKEQRHLLVLRKRHKGPGQQHNNRTTECLLATSCHKKDTITDTSEAKKKPSSLGGKTSKVIIATNQG